jgi:hypothetical protein
VLEPAASESRRFHCVAPSLTRTLILTIQELAMIVGKANEANKANGLPEVDFFETMDVNKDGKVTEDESREFFMAMTKAAAEGKDEL